MESYKSIILPVLEKHFPKGKIYLFGSRATGKARDGSDIDIAIKENNRIDLSRIFQARIELDDKIIPVEMDIVDFQILPKNMQEDIEKEGILWKK